jgi:hypothetical protein
VARLNWDKARRRAPERESPPGWVPPDEPEGAQERRLEFLLGPQVALIDRFARLGTSEKRACVSLTRSRLRDLQRAAVLEAKVNEARGLKTLEVFRERQAKLSFRFEREANSLWGDSQ